MIITGKPQLVRLLAGNKILSYIICSLFCLSCCPPNHENSIMQGGFYDSITKKYVYTVVDQMPEYIGGESEFLMDFVNSFKYRASDKQQIQTYLKVQFVVDVNGRLTGARIYDKGLSNLSEFEVAGLKTLGRLGKWKSGKRMGQNVNVLLTKRINVDLNRK